jgi:hypothetical protein
VACGAGAGCVTRWWMAQEGEVPLWYPTRVQSFCYGIAAGALFMTFSLLIGMWLEGL